MLKLKFPDTMKWTTNNKTFKISANKVNFSLDSYPICYAGDPTYYFDEAL